MEFENTRIVVLWHLWPVEHQLPFSNVPRELSYLHRQCEFVSWSPSTGVLFSRSARRNAIRQNENSPTGSWWNLRSRTSCLSLSFSSVTLRKIGSSSWSANQKPQHRVRYSTAKQVKIEAYRDRSYSRPSVSPSLNFHSHQLRLPLENIDWSKAPHTFRGQSC